MKKVGSVDNCVRARQPVPISFPSRSLTSMVAVNFSSRSGLHDINPQLSQQAGIASMRPGRQWHSTHRKIPCENVTFPVVKPGPHAPSTIQLID